MDAERRSQTIIISSRGESHPNSNANRRCCVPRRSCKQAHAWTHTSPRRRTSQRVAARNLRMRSLHRASCERTSAASRRRTSHGTNASGIAPTRLQIGTASISELRPPHVCFQVGRQRSARGEERYERNSAHEETTVIKHGCADGRTRHGVSSEHAERRASAGRRTIERRRATTRARRASATEGARPG
jgi:hypothetical protein